MPQNNGSTSHSSHLVRLAASIYLMLYVLWLPLRHVYIGLGIDIWSITSIHTQLSQHPFAAVILAVPTSILLYLVINEIVRYQARNLDFDGPLNLPVVGNIPDIAVNAAERFRTWVPKYGNVYQIQLGNVPIIVVNSASAAKELFGHQGHALSSRPVFYTFHKVRCKSCTLRDLPTAQP